jgi:hypothetical protein
MVQLACRPFLSLGELYMSIYLVRASLTGPNLRALKLGNGRMGIGSILALLPGMREQYLGK